MKADWIFSHHLLVTGFPTKANVSKLGHPSPRELMTCSPWILFPTKFRFFKFGRFFFKFTPSTESTTFPANDKLHNRFSLGKFVILLIRLSVRSMASNKSLVTAKCSMEGMDKPRMRISRSPRGLVLCSDWDIISAESLIFLVLFYDSPVISLSEWSDDKSRRYYLLMCLVSWLFMEWEERLVFLLEVGGGEWFGQVKWLRVKLNKRGCFRGIIKIERTCFTTTKHKNANKKRKPLSSISPLAFIAVLLSRTLHSNNSITGWLA